MAGARISLACRELGYDCPFGVSADDEGLLPGAYVAQSDHAHDRQIPAVDRLDRVRAVTRREPPPPAKRARPAYATTFALSPS